MHTRGWTAAILMWGLVGASLSRAGAPAQAALAEGTGGAPSRAERVGGPPAYVLIRESWRDFLCAPNPARALAFAITAERVRATVGEEEQPGLADSLCRLAESAARLAHGLDSQGPDLSLLPHASTCLRLMAELFPEEVTSKAGALNAAERLKARLASAGELYQGISEPEAADAMAAGRCAMLAAWKSEDPASTRFWMRAAVPEFGRAVAADRDSWRPLFELGWAYFDGIGDYLEAHAYFEQAGKLRDCPSYVYRFAYRCYEHLLDLPLLLPALEEAKRHHPEDKEHQRIVQQDIEFWKTHQDDAETQRRIILATNTDLMKRGAPFLLYPGNRFWVVCPNDGLPNRKGTTVCEQCGGKLE